MSSETLPVSSAARSLSPGAIAVMLMLCLSWGFNQIAVKLALPDMPPLLQAKILRVVQEQSFERVGGNETIQTHVRVITATNQDLAKLIAEGKSAEEAVAAKPFADLDAKVGSNEEASANFVRVVYYSLKPKQ